MSGQYRKIFRYRKDYIKKTANCHIISLNSDRKIDNQNIVNQLVATQLFGCIFHMSFSCQSIDHVILNNARIHKGNHSIYKETSARQGQHVSSFQANSIINSQAYSIIGNILAANISSFMSSMLAISQKQLNGKNDQKLAHALQRSNVISNKIQES